MTAAAGASGAGSHFSTAVSAAGSAALFFTTYNF
jgi:hypothetical protein